MSEDLIRYGALVESALRGVVREVLRIAAKGGLPGNHHFYITCRTRHPGIQLPAYLRERHPDEITLVIQHQYWDLVVGEQAFEVTLTFGGKSERLKIPFGAISGFADPSVEFGLQFRPAEAAAPAAQAATPAANAAAVAEEPAEPKEKVVKLDTFRKA